jgi:hypothetical protein
VRSQNIQAFTRGTAHRLISPIELEKEGPNPAALEKIMRSLEHGILIPLHVDLHKVNIFDLMLAAKSI